MARVPSIFVAVAAIMTCLTSTNVGAQDLVIGEILLDPAGVNTGRQVVEIRNLTDKLIVLDQEDIWLRFPPNAWRFPAGSLIDPRGTLIVHLNKSGEHQANEYFTGSQRNLKTADSIALYRTNLFQEPAQLLHFVQWGAGAQGGEDVAVAKGIWPAGQAIDVSDLRPGASVVYLRDQEGVGVPSADEAIGAWCLDGSPSLGESNDECTTPAVQSGVRFHEIGLRGTNGSSASFVEITNTGSVLEDLGTLSLAIDGVDIYEFPLGTIVVPGGYVVVHLGVDGNDTTTDKFTGSDSFGPLGKAGRVSLHLRGVEFDDATGMVDFVLWGGDEAPLLAAAQAAGLWPDPVGVVNDGLHSTGAIVSVEGVGAAGWAIDNTPTPGLANDADPASSSLIINELLLEPEGENAGLQVIELANYDEAASFDLSGVTLCFTSSGIIPSTSCVTFDEGTAVASEGFLVVHVNAVGENDAENVYTGELADLTLDGGDAAIYLSSDLEDVNNLADFVLWGSSHGSTVEAAVATGLWPADDSISVEGLSDGSSIAYVVDDDGEGGGAAGGSVRYRIDNTPSIGAPNAEQRGQEPFIRGDCNDDGSVDISDAVASFEFLFNGGEQPLCRNACDGNNDNSVDISDPVFVLNYLFRGAAQPEDPGRDGTCGSTLGFGEPPCDAYVSCPEI